MSDFKKGQTVKAKTVLGTKYASGKITDVREGLRGKWFSVKLDDGSIINTRAACLKS